jgi:hypothetical protein
VITISTNKGLIKVENWADIEERVGFLKDLNPADHELDSIIGRYVFADKIRCGLSTCHKPHAKGYIVATKSGRETNIGKDCGKTYFGVDFEILTKQFDRDITESDNRDLLWNFRFQLHELESKIEALRREKRGADWVYKHSQSLINLSPRCPAEVVRRVSAMVKTKSNLLSVQREATKQEIENLEVIQKKKLERPYYIDEPIAEIAGIEVLYPENDLRKLLVLELEENIKVFKAKDVDSMTFDQLAYWKKWATSVERTLDVAGAAVAAGQRLLTPANMRPFLKTLERPEDATLFRTYVTTIMEGAE